MTAISQIGNIKDSVVTKESLLQPRNCYVTYCQVCGWYGYPFEKIIREFDGFRSEEDDGFAYKFTDYDCDAKTIGEKRTKHVHKYNPKLVQEAVDFALRMRNGDGSQQK
jgi:hypothetical protein